VLAAGPQSTTEPGDMAKPAENRAQQHHPFAIIPEDEIDLVLGYGSPNPTRDGCSSYDLLVVLSRRERPIDNRTYEHLVKCSPCYRRVRSLHQASVNCPRPTLDWIAPGSGSDGYEGGHEKTTGHCSRRCTTRRSSSMICSRLTRTMTGSGTAARKTTRLRPLKPGMAEGKTTAWMLCVWRNSPTAWESVRSFGSRHAGHAGKMAAASVWAVVNAT
jgi:hypothetical protein